MSSLPEKSWIANPTSSSSRVHGRLVVLAAIAILIPTGANAQSRSKSRKSTSSPRGVVCLKARQPDVNDQNQNCGLLIRELFRQALLVAARDELGLSTRDLTLREPMAPLTNGKTVLDMETRFVFESGLEVRVFDASKEDKLLWEDKIPQPEPRKPDFCALTTQATNLSKKEFVEILSKAGYKKLSVAPPSSTKVPEFAKNALNSMDYVQQFGAIRQIHAVIRKKGASQELHGALVRAYANLGVLTEFHLTGANDVFKARALIYAERMVMSEPGAPLPLWHRAYALAMAGVHVGAMSDLDAAKKLAESSEITAPAWVAMVDALCRYDTKQLHKLGTKEGRWQELALLMEFMTIEYSRSGHLIMTTAERLLDVSPTCYRVHDAKCNAGGVSNLHSATVYGPMIMAAYLPIQLLQLPGMPNSLAKSLSARMKSDDASEDSDESDEETAESSDEYLTSLQSQIPKIVQSLTRAAEKSDRGEPSWAALGNLVEDTLLVHLLRRADFLKYAWGVESDEFVNNSLPLVKRHPLALCLGSYLLDVGKDAEDIRSLTRDCKLDDIQMGVRLWTRRLNAINDGQRTLGATILWRAMRLGDATATDLARMESVAAVSTRGSYSQYLLAMNPNHPLGIADKILGDWESMVQGAKLLEEKFANRPEVLDALATKYAETGKQDDAIRCLRAYLKIAPDSGIFNRLADTYKQRGDIDRWRDTMLEMLQHKDYGLQHARVRVEVANQYMKEGNYKKALPLAEKAAESWAFFAMECASRANEGAGKWKRAELWSRRITERYNDHPFAWFFWCARTGKGKAKSAEAIAEDRANRVLGGRASSSEEDSTISFLVLQKEFKEAKSLLRSSFGRTLNPFTGLFLAGLADIDGDASTRDNALKQVVEQGEEYSRRARVPVRSELIKLAGLMQKALAGADLDLALINNIAETGEPGEAANMYYFTHLFLQARGEKDLAVEYLKKAAEHPFRVKLVQMIACKQLRQRKIDYKHVVPYSGY